MRTFLPFLTLLPIALLPAACKNNQKAAGAAAPSPATEQVGVTTLGGPTAADSLVFMLQRTHCFGRCPVYKIEVFRSGHATYDGVLNVERLGQHRGRVSLDVLNELVQRADSIGFSQMPDAYDADVTDLPSSIVRVVANGYDKQVKARVGTPQRLRLFVEHAESLLLPLDWQPVEQDH
jgi:hypothetical protein